MARGQRLWVAAAAVVAIGTAGMAWRAHVQAAAVPVRALGPLGEADAGVEAWCAPGLDAIAGGGCLAAPEGVALPVPLVVYLHGMYDLASPQEEMDRQRRVAARATAAGYAVLALRSSLAACHPTESEYATRYCWPSNEQVADRAAAFVEGWNEAMRSADGRVGRGPRYVLGFSSGGYFAGLLAVRALFPGDAFVVAHAGPVEPVKAYGRKSPILLLSADDDVSQEGMIRLDAELTREAWPHAHAARGGGHALTDWDIDSALAFFTDVRRAPAVVRGPASGHAPRGRERDAGPEAPATDVSDTDTETATTGHGPATQGDP